MCMQLGLTALRKAEKPRSSFQKFIDHALEFVPDLREDVYACAVEGHSERSIQAIMEGCHGLL